MTFRLHIFLASCLALLLAALLALGSASANPTSGGYQLFERAASGISADIQLASLANFAPSPETASEYAIAPDTAAGYPSLARPNVNAQGNVILGDLDDLGRPTGVTSTITSDMIGTGTSANPAIRPPGFEGGANNHSRGHLLANILGGSGNDARNLVTLFQRNANSPNMRYFENQVRNAVDSGEVVNFRAIPIYSGNSTVPTGVTMTARGSGGFDLDISIQNINGLAQ